MLTARPINRSRTKFQNLKCALNSRACRRAGIAALITGCVIAVFWQQLSGIAVFIGESDRLNSYLNMRLAEYDSLRELGRMSAWDPSMFGGFSTAALHWINPGTDPVSWFLQLFPRQDVYQALGYVSILSILAACAAAYAYIRDVVGPGAVAAAASVCYGLSVFSIHRMAQVDNAHLTIVLLPLGMLAIRRTEPDRLLAPFIGLCATLTALAYWGYLQEAAYAYLFLGVYMLYRAALTLRADQRGAVALVGVFAMAAVVALTIAAPRLLTLVFEQPGVVRAPSATYSGYFQLFRLFQEGIFGRYWEEQVPLAHSINLHEGLQLVSSTMLVLFVCLGVLRPTRWIEAVAAVWFLAMIIALYPMGLSMRQAANVESTTNYVLTLAFICSATLAFAVWRVALSSQRSSKIAAMFGNLVPTSRPSDASFHLVALIALLTMILTQNGYDAVHKLFAGADFTHSRLSVLIILPLCTLFAIYLSELKDLPMWRAAAGTSNSYLLKVLRRVLAGLAIVLVALVAWLIHGPFVDQWVPIDAFKLTLFEQYHAVPAVLAKVALTAVVLLALVVWLVIGSRRISKPTLAALLVATFAVVETGAYAHFKVAGAHTWTFPVPFRNYNYMNVTPPLLRPPKPQQLAQFAKALEVDRYRSVLVNEPWSYSGVRTPHVAEFWRARIIGGYGAGIPQRLDDLPWPTKVRTQRSIEFLSMHDIDPMLMALLNVKYILVLTPSLYFNTNSPEAGIYPATVLTLQGVTYPGKVVTLDGVTFGVVENVIEPLPRHFLVASVTGVSQVPRVGKADTGGPSDRQTIDDVGLLRHHALAEKFAGTRNFDDAGSLEVSYRGDTIDVRVSPSDQPRFLIINDSYHPDWSARVGDAEIPVFPTNAVMMGIEIPPATDHVLLRFIPFSARSTGHVLTIAGIAFLLIALVGLWLHDDHSRRRRAKQNP